MWRSIFAINRWHRKEDMRSSRSPPLTAGSAIGGAQVDPLHRQLGARLEASKLNPSIDNCKRGWRRPGSMPNSTAWSGQEQRPTKLGPTLFQLQQAGSRCSQEQILQRKPSKMKAYYRCHWGGEVVTHVCLAKRKQHIDLILKFVMSDFFDTACQRRFSSQTKFPEPLATRSLTEKVQWETSRILPHINIPRLKWNGCIWALERCGTHSRPVIPSAQPNLPWRRNSSDGH
jgi:hypothetical protein